MGWADVCGKTSASNALNWGKSTGLIVLTHLRAISGILPRCTSCRLGHPEFSAYPL